MRVINPSGGKSAVGTNLRAKWNVYADRSGPSLQPRNDALPSDARKEIKKLSHLGVPLLSDEQKT